jgi:hypothetical protein
MGKITLEFNSEEEANDARIALDGQKWKMAMWDLDQKLRSTTKYGISLLNPSLEASSEEVDIADKIRENIQDILNIYNLNLLD